MTQKTNTARVITAADTSNKALGRSATEWRNDFALQYFSDRADFDAQTENKKAQKPRFEVHERETAKREYRLTLMERNNANQLKEVSSVRVGMFGKLLDRPAKKEQTPAAEVEQTEVS